MLSSAWKLVAFGTVAASNWNKCSAPCGGGTQIREDGQTRLYKNKIKKSSKVLRKFETDNKIY